MLLDGLCEPYQDSFALGLAQPLRFNAIGCGLTTRLKYAVPIEILFAVGI